MIITLSSSRKLEQLTVWMTVWWLKKSIILAEFSLTTTKKISIFELNYKWKNERKIPFEVSAKYS